MNKTVSALAIALALGIATVVQAGAAAPVAPVREMSQSQMNQSAMNWFGGPTYNGAPSLAATAALVKAGGGASDFSFFRALVSMLGEKTVNAEVAKLDKQYGQKNVTDFIDGMTFAVDAALKRATAAGVSLPPPPAGLEGARLAEALVKAGTAPDGVWWSGYLFDVALSHDIHVQVMQDIDAKFGHAADENTHRILNQAMYDVAQALKVPNVKLASLH